MMMILFTVHQQPLKMMRRGRWEGPRPIRRKKEKPKKKIGRNFGWVIKKYKNWLLLLIDIYCRCKLIRPGREEGG